MRLITNEWNDHVVRQRPHSLFHTCLYLELALHALPLNGSANFLPSIIQTSPPKSVEHAHSPFIPHLMVSSHVHVGQGMLSADYRKMWNPPTHPGDLVSPSWTNCYYPSFHLKYILLYPGHLLTASELLWPSVLSRAPSKYNLAALKHLDDEYPLSFFSGTVWMITIPQAASFFLHRQAATITYSHTLCNLSNLQMCKDAPDSATTY